MSNAVEDVAHGNVARECIDNWFVIADERDADTALEVFHALAWGLAMRPYEAKRRLRGPGHPHSPRPAG